MKIAIIGRSGLLYAVAEAMYKAGYEIPLVISAKAAPEYNKTERDFETFAASVGAKYIYSAKINEGLIQNEIKKCAPIDIAVSINYSGIISEDVIKLFRHGILNAHGGDLPRYRGNACLAWAIINKEEKVALCVHKMIGGELDSGDIIAREYLDINMNTKIGGVYQWMEECAPSLMLNAVTKLSENPDYILEVQSKDPRAALRCYPRMPEDGQVDWSRTNEEIVRLVNASSEPFSGAFCFFEDRKTFIWDARLISDNENLLGIPGQVTRVNVEDGSIEVLTGRGKIAVCEIEVEGVRMKPFELIRSIRKRLR